MHSNSGANRASAATAPVADRDHNGAVSARSSTSQGARRIRGEAREECFYFELSRARRPLCERQAPRNLRAHSCITGLGIIMLAAVATPEALRRAASIHASPVAAQTLITQSRQPETRANAAQLSTQAAPLHQHPQQHACSSDRCLICLTRPDDYEDVSRGMTCGMCSACGTFFCGIAPASVAAPSTRLIKSKRRRVQTPARP